MWVSDVKVFETIKKIAVMEPALKRVVQFFDADELEKKVQGAVVAGIKKCSFVCRGKGRVK